MSASCKHIQRELIPLFPQDLDARDAALVRDHVASCPACAAELGVFVAQASRLATAREERRAPGLDLWAGIQKRLAEPEPARTIDFPAPAKADGATARGGARAFALAASLLVGLGLGFLAWERGGAGPVSPSPSPENLANTPRPSTSRDPVFVKKGEPKAPRPSRRISPRLPRTLFEDDSDFKVAEERQLLPLDDDDAVVPGSGKGYGHLDAEPEAPRKDREPEKPNQKPSDRPLRF